MLKASYEEAKRLLSANSDALDKIAAFLIEKETITGKEFMKIFREVKGIPEPEEADGEKKEEQESGRILMKPTETQAAARNSERTGNRKRAGNTGNRNTATRNGGRRKVRVRADYQY